MEMVLGNELFGGEEGPGRIPIERYNEELDEAEAEFENGDFVTHEELLKQIKKW